jgi:ribosomal protein S18 acetylase RimI-like enzyme
VSDLTPPRGLVLVARRDGRPVGCAGLKLVGDGVGEVKRVWVSTEARGAGIGRRLMDEVEARARAAGCDRLRLDTNHTLTEAIAMYRGRGYREVAPFNDEQYADHWFEKPLEPDEPTAA